MDALAATVESRPWRRDGAIRLARVAGVEWPFIDTGAQAGPGAPTLVMLPGSVGTCEMFFKQIDALGGDIRIVSVGYPADPDPARLADGLAGLLDALRIERAHVLGSSFGAYWSQFFALRRPARVQTLFLGNGFVTPQPLFANPLFAPERVTGQTAAQLQAMWRDRVAQNPDSELRRIQLDMLGGRQSADNLKARFVGVIEAVRCPPLAILAERIVIIDCADDPIIPPAARAAVHAHYPGAEVHTLERGGHYPHILNPDAYNSVITSRVLDAKT